MKHMLRMAALLLTLLTVLGAMPLALAAPAPEEAQNTLPGVTLTLDKKSYSRFGLALKAIIKNKTAAAYDFGFRDFCLDQQVNGVWQRLERNPDVHFVAMQILIMPKKTLRHSIGLTDHAGVSILFGVLEPGRYRVVIPVQNEQSGEKHLLSAEFDILPDTLLYATEPVNARTGAGMEHAIVRELALGEGVPLIEAGRKWTKVLCDGTPAYVYSKYLNKTQSKAYYNHPIGQLIGKKNIKRIACETPKAGVDHWAFSENTVPVFAAKWTVKTRSKGTLFTITEYQYETEEQVLAFRTAAQAAAAPPPGWPKEYWQAGNRVVCLSFERGAVTAKELALYANITAGLTELYGSAILHQ